MKKIAHIAFSANEPEIYQLGNDLQLISLYNTTVEAEQSSYSFEALKSKLDVFFSSDNFDGFLIELKQKNDANLAIWTVLYIRMSRNLLTKNLTIALISKIPFEAIAYETQAFNALPFFFIRFHESDSEDIINTLIDDFIGTPLEVKPKVLEKNLYLLEDTLFRQEEYSNHQITNEWGAFKLAFVAKFYDLLPEIEQLQRGTMSMYFQYLKWKTDIPILDEIAPSASNVHPIQGKFLLIDDNYDKGWEKVFLRILAENGIGLHPFAAIKDFAANELEISERIIETIENEGISGVLLDLRLTKEDDAPGNANNSIEEFSGGRLLKKIKETYPHVPVIMITASNKAWNMRQLIDLGADGYFIKESPKETPSIEVAEKNYSDFCKLLSDSQKKYEELAPFWKKIRHLKNHDLLIFEKDIPETTGDQTKVKERVLERLEMFFGLLKRSYEDTSYNDRFYYSDKKLAFFTLWSCLNEIQYIYLSKTLNDSGKCVTMELSSSLATHLELYDEEKYLFKERKIKIKEIREEETFHYYDEFTAAQKPPDQSIGLQIAFLIACLCSTHRDSDLKDRLAKKLYELKDKRNKLYLAHGNDSALFYAKTEKHLYEVTLSDCTSLFEIVEFLLTGEITNDV